MYPLFISVFITLVTILFDIRYKCIKPTYQYLLIFFAIAGINFLFASKLHAEKFDLFNNSVSMQVIIETKRDSKPNPLKEVYKSYYYGCKDKMDYHWKEGCKSLNEAEEASFFLPNISEQDKAAFCFTNIIATLSPGDPKVKIVTAALAICAQYGSMVMVEWQRVDSKLQQAKYHFEMEEHYRFTGKYIQDLLNLMHKQDKDN